MGAEEKRRHGLSPWLMLTGVAAVYLASMPLKFVTHDAADELALVLSENAAPRSNHLLLTHLYKLAVATARAVGFDGAAFVPPQLVNIGAGVVSVGIAFRLAQEITRSAAWGGLLATLVATSYLWFHASTMETGAVATSLLFCALWLTWRNRTRSAFATFVAWGLASAGALFAMNQVVLLPAFGLALVLDLRRDKISAVRHLVAAGCGVLLCLLLPLGVAAGAAGVSNGSGLLTWLGTHADQQRLSDVSFGPMGLLRSFSGFVRLWFATSSGPTVVKAALSGVELRDMGAFAWIELGAGLLLSGGILLLCANGVRTADGRSSVHEPWLWGSVMGLATVFLFGGFWLGSDPQFWLPALPFLLVLLAGGIQRLRVEHPEFDRPGKSVLAFCCATTFWFNAPRETPSALFPHGGPAFVKAELLAKGLSPRDVVLTPGAGWAIYSRHYIPNLEVVNLAYADELGEGETFLANVTRLIEDTWQKGGEVHFDGLLGPMLASQVGYWNMVNNARGVERDALSRHLAERMRLEPSYGEGLSKLVSRTPQLPATPTLEELAASDLHAETEVLP